MQRQIGILIFLCFMVLTSPDFSKAIEIPVKEKEIKYNQNSVKIADIKHHIDFNVHVPKNAPNDWTLEIKTYPWEAKTNFTNFRLHYMDRNDEKMMVSIEQMKGSMKPIEDNNPNGKTVTINGHTGKLIKWGNDGEVDYK